MVCIAAVIAAQLNMKGAAEHSNDKHVPVWTKLCQEHKILNTPLTPYIDKELLYNNHLFVDGTKITKDSKFAYKEKLTEQSLKEVVQVFIKQVRTALDLLLGRRAHASACYRGCSRRSCNAASGV